MTNVSSNVYNYLASFFAPSQVSQASQVSGDAAGSSDSSVSSVNQSSGYGPAYILDINFSGSSGSASPEDISNITLAYSPGDAGSSNGVQSMNDNNPFAQFLASVNGSTSSGSGSAGTPGTFGSTHFDQFLTQLAGTSSGSGASSGSGSSGLTATQQQAVQSILTQYQDAPATPATFQAVHSALQQAGVTIAPHFGHHGGGGMDSALLTSSASGSSASGSSLLSGTSSSSGNGSSTDTALLQMVEQILSAVNNSLQNAATANTAQSSGSGTSAVSSIASTSSGSGSSASGTFASTRLDQFLTQLVGASSGSGSSTSSGSGSSALTATQQQAVQNILSQYQSAPATPATFQAVHDALQQAGVTVGHHHGGGMESASSASSASGSSASGSSEANLLTEIMSEVQSIESAFGIGATSTLPLV